jgi:hypothetical protein
MVRFSVHGGRSLLRVRERLCSCVPPISPLGPHHPMSIRVMANEQTFRSVDQPGCLEAASIGQRQTPSAAPLQAPR